MGKCYDELKKKIGFYDLNSLDQMILNNLDISKKAIVNQLTNLMHKQ